MKTRDRSTGCGVSTPRWVRAAEGALLVLVLSVGALRATFTEVPHVEAIGQTTALSNEAISLLLSGTLFGAAGAWVVLAAATGRWRWRRTYVGTAVGVFCAAAVAGVWFASDRRAALTDLAVLLSGPAAGLLAVQLFDRRETVRLFLWLLLAVGAAATYACYDKMTSASEQLVAEYEKEPEAFLALFGIEAGSLEHWQYEHRLYSRDVSGFLTTSNSTGSFFLLAVFGGIGLCIEAFRARRGSEETLTALVCAALATGISLAGLMMTQSKGAVGAFLMFGVVLCVCVGFGRRLWGHRRAACAVLVIAAVFGVGALTVYGVRHGRLPGGNSMLVRWQYWTASAAMAMDMPVWGTGGGNYATYYLTYKNPAAPETINDPHNWVFSLLCRFGVIGLAAMGCALIRPVGRLFASGLAPAESCGGAGLRYGERYFWLALFGGVMAVMVGVRSALFDLAGPGSASAEQAAAFFLMIVIPAGIVAVVFGLLRFSGVGDVSVHRLNPGLVVSIACGLGAVLVHNLVDFALFEPGVWTLFWLVGAAGLSLAAGSDPDGGFRVAALGRRQRIAAGVLPVMVCGVIAAVVIVPPVRRGALVYRAMGSAGAVEAAGLFAQATAVDRLSPSAAVTGARVMLHRFGQRPGAKDMSLLESSRVFAETAIARTASDPRPRRLLGDILLALAETAAHEGERLAFQERAYAALQAALARYPGSDMLCYRLGVLAETLGRDAEAAAYLERALAIETAYRAQFRVMYPAQAEVVSRLGPTVYADLIERLERLRGTSPGAEPFVPCD